MQQQNRWWAGWVATLLGMGMVLGQSFFINPYPYSFDGALEGRLPTGALLPLKGQLYGVTKYGGAADAGTLFRIDASGWSFTNLHMFANNATNGAVPNGALTYCNGRLYGVTEQGGAGGYGTLYSIGPDGSGFLIHQHFTNRASGTYPIGPLLASGSMLYGKTATGGSNGLGVIFSYWTGWTFPGISRLSILHAFGYAPTDASSSIEGMALIGTSLYGLASRGGANNYGALYRLHTDGTGFTLLHSFEADPYNGFAPVGGVVARDTMLYGMTTYNGTNSYGVCFSYDTTVASNAYRVLHRFHGGTGDGAYPYANPVIAGSNFYGTTARGGLGDGGTLFRMKLDGSGFTLLAPGITNGPGFDTTPVVFGNAVYVLSPSGGVNNCGAICKLPFTVEPKVFFQTDSGQLANWALNSTGGFVRSTVMNNTGSWQLKAAGDLNGDGVADLFFVDGVTGFVAVWLMNADGTIFDNYCIGRPGGWSLRAAGDYEMFGCAQVFFQTPGGAVAYWRMNPDGSFNASVPLGSSSWMLRGAGDLDGDGKAELFWQNAAGQVAIWYHNTDGSIRSVVAFSTGAWALCGVCDVDGDGVCDLIWQTPDTRTAGWFMNTNGTTRSAGFWWPTGGWKLKAAGR